MFLGQQRSVISYHLKIMTTYFPDCIQQFVCGLLSSYADLCNLYNAEEIVTKTYARSDGSIDLNTFDEVHFAWFKTTCIMLLEELNQQYERKCQLNSAVEKLFEKGNPEADSLWAFIERLLWQYRLRDAYDVKDVLIEAYAIAVKRIEQGLVIQNYLGWLRGTCHNTVRKLRRKQDKADRPKLDPTNQTLGDEVVSRIMCSEDFKAVRLAWQKLSSEEQELVGAKYIQGKSWQQIAEALSQEQECRLDENTVRQRGYRAVQKLKKLYREIREEVKLDDTDS